MQTLTRNTLRRERPVSGANHSILFESGQRNTGYTLMSRARVTMRDEKTGERVEGRAVVNGGQIVPYVEEADCGS